KQNVRTQSRLVRAAMEPEPGALAIHLRSDGWAEQLAYTSSTAVCGHIRICRPAVEAQQRGKPDRLLCTACRQGEIVVGFTDVDLPLMPTPLNASPSTAAVKLAG